MAAVPKTDTYYAPDRKAWRKWLEKHHATSAGIWLIYFKKGSGKSRVPYADAVEEALCFGWIDTTSNPIDEDSYMQLFTPRKPKSTWSKLNKDRVEQLIADGLMTPAGMACIEEAKANGMWKHLDKVEALTAPPELEAALKKNKKALEFFEGLGTWNKKYILYYLNNAKRAETKARRLDEMMVALKEARMPDRFRTKPAKE